MPNPKHTSLINLVINEEQAPQIVPLESSKISLLQ
jgi:hypothetical protein